MDDIIEGIYHGKGPDYTEAMEKYLDKIEDGTDGTSSEIVYPERQGCVAVDSELAVMLQALMDKFTFEGVDHSWTKLCYYYKSLEAPLSVEEKLEQLNEMLENSNVASETIQGEINIIVEELNAMLENSSVDFVKRSWIDSAMVEIYRLIEADKEQQ